MKLLHPILPVAALVFTTALSAAAPEAASAIPDYSQTERAQVPEQFKFNVADLFKDEAAWRAELAAVKQLAVSIDGLAKNWTSSPKLTADLLDLVNAVNERGDGLFAWAKLQNDMDLSNPEFTRMQSEFQSLAVDFTTRATFIAPDILKLGAEKVAEYLTAEPRLAPNRFFLERILRNREHTLSQPEESIVAQMGLFTDTPVKVANLLSDVDMPSPEVTLTDGTKVVLNENAFLKYRLSKVAADRRTVVEAYWTNVRKYENTFAALLDGEMKKQVALSRIYKFPSCLEATLFENNISPQVYHNVIATVRANVGPLLRLFKLKQKMLGLSELNYYDIPVPAAPSVSQEYTIEDSQRHVLAATAPLGAEYAANLKHAFAERWIDLYPNKGKQGGAYSLGVYGVHPFVKMNFSGRYDDMSTIAHELGHSMHSVFASAAQPFPTAQYAIFIAEIASTFNETMLVKEVVQSTTDDRVKLSLLESFLDRMRGTIYAQAMFAEFELAMHEQAEKGLPLTAEWLKATFAALYRHYMGVDQGVVKCDETLAVMWASIPHFYRPFYVFQYTTGMVAATALAEAVSTGGETARDRYLGMLRAGGSKFPLDILRDAGVDMSKPEPILAAIKQFDTLVAEMETIYARLPQTETK